MNPESSSGLRTWQWVVTAIVVIVLIVIGIMVFGGKKSAPTETPSMTGTSTATNAPGVSSIVMSDQYPGNVVYLSSVQVANPSWVAIHKDANGKPGAIIGSAHVNAGINPVKITLSEPMIDGGTYYAMLHSDDGDGKFDATKDAPLQDSNGNAIMRVFHGSASAGNSVKG